MQPVYLPFVFALVLTLPALTSSDDANQKACARWAKMASDMTGEGKTQICKRKDPPDCTRLDCSGAARFSHFMLPGTKTSPFNVSYCFGMQLNSCSQPMSMDFYLQLPNVQYSHAFRVSEDKNIELSNVKFPLGQGNYATPQLDFKFERQENSNVIKMSVITKVEVHMLGSTFFIDGLERTLVDQETIHALPCPGGATARSNSTEPPADFMPQCHPHKFNFDSVPQSTLQIPASETLNKTCDNTLHLCSHGEMCDFGRSPHICICSPDSNLSPKYDACVKQSRQGQACNGHDDCGLNELCEPDKKGKVVCHCEQGNYFDLVRHMCVRPPPGTDHSTPVNPGTPGTSSNSSTPAEDHTKPSASPKKEEISGKSKVPVIVGATVGGGALLTAVIIANIYLFRRYKQRRREGDINLISDSSAPLLGTDDDDVNLIM